MFIPFFFCCLLITGAETTNCEFNIHRETRIPPGAISFDYIGNLSCDSEKTQKEINLILQKLTIGTIYPYSPPFSFKKNYLIDKWQQFNREFNLNFTGAEAIKIQPELLIMDNDAIKTLAYKEILSQLTENSKYEIIFHNFPENISLPSQEYNIEFDAKRALQGHLRLRITSGGRLQKQYFIRFTLREKKIILKTLKSIPARSPINPESLEICEEFVDLKKDYIDAELIHETADLFSKRPIPEGTILTHENIRFLEIIKNRQSINGILTNGNININIPLTALQSGRRGDRILLEDKHSRKRYYGRIIDAGNARIEY
jgi:flagella basal body P-ring formation protein FlgA